VYEAKTGERDTERRLGKHASRTVAETKERLANTLPQKKKVFGEQQGNMLPPTEGSNTLPLADQMLLLGFLFIQGPSAQI
jgi:hypothetical protein